LGIDRLENIDHVADCEEEIAEGQAKYESAREGSGVVLEVGVDHVECPASDNGVQMRLT
jgi:hypothetical protein